MRINIAIDGPSASGKSTLAKALAQRLDYTHIDTGAMYRACALIASDKELNISDEENLVNAIKSYHMSFNNLGHICLNDVDVNDRIRTKEIDILTSKVSTLPKVRQKMVEYQQAMAKDKGFVLDGRDIGSVVLPSAELKIFQIASIEARAQRRFDEYLKKGQNVNLDDIKKDIAERDERDQLRSNTHLKKTSDAIELDTSNLSIEEMVNFIYEKVLKLTQKEVL